MSRIWPLPFPIPDDVIAKASDVKLVMFDVDGVMTDGSLTYGPNGEEFKTFHIHDGQGVKLLLDNHIEVAVVSGRGAPALMTRAKELGIRHVRTGERDKRAAFHTLLEECSLNEKQCCFVGDDLLDIPVMLECILGIAVADAHHAVRHIAEWVTPSPGGRGAVREVCDVILYAQEKFDAMMDTHMKFPAIS